MGLAGSTPHLRVLQGKPTEGFGNVEGMGPAAGSAGLALLSCDCQAVPWLKHSNMCLGCNAPGA